MPTRAAPLTDRRNRPVTADELRQFAPGRTAKYVAALLDRRPHVVRAIAKRHELPLARERAERGSARRG